MKHSFPNLMALRQIGLIVSPMNIGVKNGFPSPVFLFYLNQPTQQKDACTHIGKAFKAISDSF